MKTGLKSCIKIAAVVFGLFLIMYYRKNIYGVAWVVLNASTPLFFGRIIAFFVPIAATVYRLIKSDVAARNGVTP